MELIEDREPTAAGKCQGSVRGLKVRADQVRQPSKDERCLAGILFSGMTGLPLFLLLSVPLL